MGTRLVLIGAGGHAREVLDIVEASVRAGEDVEVLGYIVEAQYSSPGTIVNDKPVLGDFDWFAKNADEIYAVCAVGDPALRLHLVHKAQNWGTRFCSIIHPNAILTQRVTIGQGVVIAAGCVLTNHIRLGDHVSLNPGCTVGHDTVIDDYVTLTQGVNVSGKVKISAGCYIGTGANIIDRINVGEWSIIGAGSTIIQDVAANTTVVGVPGRVTKTRCSGWHTEW